MAFTTVLSNLHIPQRLRSLGKSSAQVREELEELIQTARIDHRALDSGLIGAHTPPYKLVKFYSVVSPWCDRNAELYELERNLARIDYGQFDKARKALKALAAQDERDIYGVNRTYSGERPTAENIFLGERVCLSTETVSYWERIRGNLGGKPALIMQPDSPATISEVIDNQALELLTSGLNRWKPLFQALIDA